LPDTAAGQTSGEPGKEILILETDAVHRDLLHMILEREGYRVECPGDPARAEVFLRTTAYFAVLLEILLPGINGLQLIRKIREDSSMYQPHFILMSTLGFKEVIKQVAPLNVSGFLKKPIDPVVLLKRLADLA
jgi:DNA-binding response OmpR family regulator